MISADQTQIIRLDLPASYQFANVLGGCIEAVLDRALSLAERTMVIYQAKLAAHETFTNIVEHAYREGPGRVLITMAVIADPNRLEIELCDAGRPFSMPEVRLPNQNGEQSKGYGLYLIHQLLEQVNYYPEAGNNRWHLVKLLPEAKEV